MQQSKRSRKMLVFLILDDKGFGWGVAPTKIEARQQMAWFLPRGNRYHMEPMVIDRDPE